jgi:2-isopropylmalate synthase
MSDVLIYDTTLRDGTQREGISLSVADKLKIAHRLDELGVGMIEAGWPGSNPKDAELFRRARDEKWRQALLVAFGATRRAGIAPEEDPQLAALVEAGTPVVAIFGKTSVLHVTDVLRVSLDENLRMIEESVAFLRASGRRVVYDAEHFFDGYRADPVYALETLRAALRGGAEVLSLCDTNGGSLPWQIGDEVSAVRRALGPDVVLGAHTHDDTGCGVANALAAVRAGARHVQGTINGYGERCGNANLCAVIPDIELKLGLRCLPEGGLVKLRDVARFVAEVANLPFDDHQAYVGRSAFSHKGGVHVAAMRRNPTSYQHIDPALVGNEARYVVSELSGRANVVQRLEELGLGGGEAATEILSEVKRREAEGFSFEAAEASTELMLRRRAPGYRAPFALLDYTCIVGRSGERAHCQATSKIHVGDSDIHTAAEGNGPVSALDGALRKALVVRWPAIARVHLVDYKVRILDGRDGTAATVRVMIEWDDGARQWSTAGASGNIIEASWQALADGYEYAVTVSNGANENVGSEEFSNRAASR